MPEREADELDSQRLLEQKALQNTRALIDKLEARELSTRGRRWLLAVVVSVPILFLVVGLAIRSRIQPVEDAENARRACELDAWNARAVAFESEARKADPGTTSRQVMRKLEDAQPALMADAKAACNRSLAAKGAPAAAPR